MLDRKHSIASKNQTTYRAPTASEIIDKLGGTTKVAKMFGIRTASVSGWRAKRIPAARLHFLTVLHPEAVTPIAVSGPPDPERRSASRSHQAGLSTADET